ncbi:hypothetical protein ED733_001670 [Metarhizium rileyi]|uniref:Uncharacterized protein n=1 Tax=Metarhizium rileyi (strain RCEF 4871) TaxID=1649241 RepID=A0A5C6G4V6_METRR|nr:hypothetical protein ED733_001670 [Metarhizium rileyi]
MIPPQNFGTQSSGPGSNKRRRLPSSHQTPDADSDCRASKKRKLRHPEFPPRLFWERLSEVPLTRNALRAFNEQGTQGTLTPLQPRTQKRSRQHSVGVGVGYQPASQIVDRYSPTSLDRVKVFARHGGPDLTDLRGYSVDLGVQNVMSSKQSSLGRRKRGSQSSTKGSSQSLSKSMKTPKTTCTKSTGPYDRTFQQHLIDHNILPYGYEYPDGRLPQEPDNIDDIRQALAQSRASLSPSKFSNEDFSRFKRADAQAHKEREVTTNIIPILKGDAQGNTCLAGELPFTNLEHLTDGTLVPGNPDLYYGARPEQLHRTIRQELNNYLVPSTQHDLPIVPNFLFQAKGPDGSLSVATRQASYDGALGARGLHCLQSYGYEQSEPKYDNNAYTLTSLYHGGQLKMYTSHPIPPAVVGGQPGFVMTQIDSWSVTGNCDAFRQGATAFRNGRDWAKCQRDSAIHEANERLSRGLTNSTFGDRAGLGLLKGDVSAAESLVTSQETILKAAPHDLRVYESETSADELSVDFQPRLKRTKSSNSS